MKKKKKVKDIKDSDDLTHEDLKVLMDPLESNESLWEETPVVSNDNATRYCAERLLETKVGKLCAKLGTRVQALVNVCSADIEVSFNQGFHLIRKGFETLFFESLTYSVAHDTKRL